MSGIRSALAAFVLSALALPVPAQETRTVEGALTYLARIALPPEAELVVEAAGIDGASLALLRRTAGGAQVPLPFALDIPRGQPAELRAAVLLGGRTEWAAAPVPVPPGTEPADMGEIVLHRHRPVGFSTAILCGERRLRLGFGAERALADTGRGLRALAQTPAASGARYEGEGLVIWLRGASALVDLDGEELPDCAVVPPVTAAEWTARGHEPGWTLAVSGGRMRLARPGAAPAEAPLPEAAIEDRAFVHAGEAMTLRVAPSVCRDAATGRPHPDAVEVDVGGATLRGCGGDPMALLAGSPWVAEDIGGAGVLDSARSFVTFGRDGRVFGSGGCNRFMGAMAVTGERAAMGPLGATMMACPEAVMRQERAFLDALGAMDGWDFDGTGALLLTSGGRPLAKLRR